jgi:hypothetical protein
MTQRTPRSGEGGARCGHAVSVSNRFSDESRYEAVCYQLMVSSTSDKTEPWNHASAGE